MTASWQAMQLEALSLPFLHPPRIPSVRLHTSMFKLPLSQKAIQAAVGSDRDCDIADAWAIGLDFAVWVFVSDTAGIATNHPMTS